MLRISTEFSRSPTLSLRLAPKLRLTLQFCLYFTHETSISGFQYKIVLYHVKIFKGVFFIYFRYSTECSCDTTLYSLFSLYPFHQKLILLMSLPRNFGEHLRFRPFLVENQSIRFVYGIAFNLLNTNRREL